MSFLGADTDELRDAGQKCQDGKETTDGVIAFLKALIIILRAASFFTGGASEAYATFLETQVVPWLQKISNALGLFAQVLNANAEAQDKISAGESVDLGQLPTYQTPSGLPPTITPYDGNIAGPTNGQVGSGDTGSTGGPTGTGTAPTGTTGQVQPTGLDPSGATGSTETADPDSAIVWAQTPDGTIIGGYFEDANGQSAAELLGLDGTGEQPVVRGDVLGSSSIAPVSGGEAGPSHEGQAGPAGGGGGPTGSGGGGPTGGGSGSGGGGTGAGSGGGLGSDSGISNGLPAGDTGNWTNGDPGGTSYGTESIGGSTGDTAQSAGTDAGPSSSDTPSYGAAAGIAGGAAALGLGGAALAARGQGNATGSNGDIERLSRSNGRGSSGEEVRELQQRLTDAGYDTRGADGQWGRNTQAAFDAYRADHPMEIQHGNGYSSPTGYDYNQIQGVQGNPNVTPEFLREVEGVSQRLGMQPEHLMAAMSFETGGEFAADTRNPNSSATGLIQFMDRTARGMGTTTEALSQMSPIDQLEYVEQYFEPHRGRLDSLESVYTTILGGHPSEPGDTMFTQGTREYRDNAGLDSNHDGRITAAEATAHVRGRMGN